MAKATTDKGKREGDTNKDRERKNKSVKERRRKDPPMQQDSTYSMGMDTKVERNILICHG